MLLWSPAGARTGLKPVSIPIYPLNLGFGEIPVVGRGGGGCGSTLEAPLLGAVGLEEMKLLLQHPQRATPYARFVPWISLLSLP